MGILNNPNEEYEKIKKLFLRKHFKRKTNNKQLKIQRNACTYC